MAVHRAPLWLINPRLPGRAMVVAKVAFRPLWGFITPRQLGPMIRMAPFLASSMTLCSSSTPAGPVSLKPAEMMTAPGTPASAHSRMRPGTVAAGVVITARSTFSGMEATLGYARTANTLGRLGLTG